MLDLVDQATQGRHVAAVLPEYVRSFEYSAEHLSELLVSQLASARRLLPWDTECTLVEAIGRVATQGDPPVTVPELIGHRELAEQCLVLSRDDLEPEHLAELPELLRRLATNTAGAPTERCSVIVVATRADLPKFAGGSSSDVNFAGVWFWNRVSRLDTAALVASHSPPSRSGGLRDEIRDAIVTEFVRWNLPLGAHLASNWKGEVSELVELCEPVVGRAQGGKVLQRHLLTQSEPPDGFVEDWDLGHVDLWHGEVTVGTWWDAVNSEVGRLVWMAQARVLLPWLELRRADLEVALRQEFGGKRFREYLHQFSNRDQSTSSDSVPEIGLLEVITRSRLGRSNQLLTDFAKALWLARNDLAHLRPVENDRVDVLVRTFEKFRRDQA